MPQYCSVPGCRIFGGHQYPRNPEVKLKWRIAIKRVGSDRNLWKPKQYDVVCSAHFTESDYRATGLLGERRKLKEDAVPSVFDFRVPVCGPSRREQRLCKRTLSQDLIEIDASTFSTGDDLLIGCEIEIGEAPTESDEFETTLLSPFINAETQCNILPSSFDNFSIELFESNSRAVQFFSGFDDFEHFMLFFNVLGPAAYDLEYKCSLMTPINQLFMTLIKLRRAKEDIELSILFNVSETTVCRLIQTWINFIYFQLQEINIWPSKQVVKETMPSSFQTKFPSTRVILDATETPIQKPSDVSDQSATFSTYKSRNTLKTMIGCTPRGFVSYVSDAYAGSTSDKQIIERSDLVVPGKFSRKDSIMSDRGIMVQDLFANNDVYVNTPTMLKGSSQLEPEAVVHDRRVASSRVHVERVIGLAKSYKILKHELPTSKVLMGSRIVYICFMLSNFRKCIVKR